LQVKRGGLFCPTLKLHVHALFHSHSQIALQTAKISLKTISEAQNHSQASFKRSKLLSSTQKQSQEEFQRSKPISEAPNQFHCLESSLGQKNFTTHLEKEV